jgi:type II secretory pathway predicted ATPase ExeA
MVRDCRPFAAPLFDGSLEPAAFHVGLPQEEALARLEWLVENRGRCGLVVGAEGLGKSHLAAMAARRLGGMGAEVAMLSLGGLPPGEWIDLLLDRLPLDARSRSEDLRPWLKLENRLRENTLMERPTVIMLDDIDRAPADAVDGIGRLVAAVEPRFSRLVVVTTATPAGLCRVPDAIRNRAVVRIELRPWSEDDVAGFLRHGLGRAGADPESFSAGAVATLARFAGGVPRIVCRLVSLALVAAAGDDLPQVDAATIERVWRELVPGSGHDAAGPDGRAEWIDDGQSAAEQPPASRVRAVRRLFG